jgi:hypothetical protein
MQELHLLELHLTPLESGNFRIIVSQAIPPIDGDADSQLPFWEDGKDWRTTIIKTLESTRFIPENFPEPGEQEWMIRNGILTSDLQSFHPSYLEIIGKALYESLLPPGSSLDRAFTSALRTAERANKDLHLRLKFPGDSASRSQLADYPWELIHNQSHFLQHRSVQISRYIAHETACPISPTHEQIQVLLISSRAADIAQGLRPLPDDEERSILTGIAKAQEEGLITFEQLRHPTRKRLSRHLTECTPVPQILHFDGHGLFGRKCNNPECRHMNPGIKIENCDRCGHQLPDPKGYLLFEDEDGGIDYVSASSFAALLPRGVELVVLSACQSGMALGGESIFNGTAQQLIDARIPAVVAMQYSVLAKAASNFGEQFYRILGQKKTLLEAISAGCKWMEVDSNQWYRPVLYLRWQDNHGGSLFVREQLTIKANTNEAQTPEPIKQAESKAAPIFKTGRKLALLIGVSDYSHGFSRLPGAITDVEALDAVLQSEELGDFEVRSLLNPGTQIMHEEIKKLFSNCSQDDLVLLFYSGHGVKDPSNQLYFGTSETRKTASGELDKASAISADFIHDVMDNCPSQQQVVVLDCCFSGAFPKGLVPKDDASINIENQLAGKGRAIMASSTELQNSFGMESEALSLYTRCFIEGICTGQADLDKDKRISVNDLHQYIKNRLQKLMPEIEPALYAEHRGESIHLTKALCKISPVHSEILRSTETRRRQPDFFL